MCLSFWHQYLLTSPSASSAGVHETNALMQPDLAYWHERQPCHQHTHTGTHGVFEGEVKGQTERLKVLSAASHGEKTERNVFLSNKIPTEVINVKWRVYIHEDKQRLTKRPVLIHQYDIITYDFCQVMLPVIVNLTFIIS